MRRGTRYCFVNNYNPVLSKSWRPNIDLHPVTKYHEAVAYMGVYCSNSEKDTSKALRQVEREIKTQKMITRVAMYEIAHAFGMLLKLQPRVLYVKNNTPSQRVRMLKPAKEIAELLEDGDEMFKPDILESEAATGGVL